MPLNDQYERSARVDVLFIYLVYLFIFYPLPYLETLNCTIANPAAVHIIACSCLYYGGTT